MTRGFQALPLYNCDKECSCVFIIGHTDCNYWYSYMVDNLAQIGFIDRNGAQIMNSKV